MVVLRIRKTDIAISKSGKTQPFQGRSGVCNYSMAASFPLQAYQEIAGELALEAAFPVHAECCLEPRRIELQSNVIEKLKSGDLYRWTKWNVEKLYITAGSQSEGIAMAPGWGQKESDRDVMLFCGGDWGVSTRIPADYPIGQLVIEDPLEDMSHNPAGYCRVYLLGEPLEFVEGRDGRDLWVGEGRKVYLSSERAVPYIRDCRMSAIQGPSQPSRDGSYDNVPTLVCSSPLSWVAGFLARKRTAQWPMEDALSDIQVIPGTLVATGHHTSPNKAIEWRISCSVQEIRLAQDMPQWVKQGYRAFKYTVRNLLTRVKCTNTGRRTISSYHLKTVLLWQLEYKQTWKRESPYNLFLQLIDQLCSRLTMGELPHYFLPKCNLLETVDESDKATVLKHVEAIQEDPVFHILDGPLYPEQVYGSEEKKQLLISSLHTLYWDDTPDDMMDLLKAIDKHRKKQVKNLNLSETSVPLVKLDKFFRQLEVMHKH